MNHLMLLVFSTNPLSVVPFSFLVLSRLVAWSYTEDTFGVVQKVLFAFLHHSRFFGNAADCLITF